MVERWTRERGLGTAVENKGDEEPHDIVNSRSSSMAGRIRRLRRKDDSIGKEAEEITEQHGPAQNNSICQHILAYNSITEKNNPPETVRM